MSIWEEHGGRECRERHEKLLVKLSHHPIHLRRYILVCEHVSPEPQLWLRVIEFYEKEVE